MKNRNFNLSLALGECEIGVVIPHSALINQRPCGFRVLGRVPGFIFKFSGFWDPVIPGSDPLIFIFPFCRPLISQPRWLYRNLLKVAEVVVAEVTVAFEISFRFVAAPGRRRANKALK